MSRAPTVNAPAAASNEARWERTVALEELVPGALRTFKSHGKQLVLGRTQDGEVFALDNRCPHEGYPLAQGTLKDCALTCCWHNWKFDVRDGSCVLGGEPVRRYATRVVDGALEVDVADPDPRRFFPGWLASFEQGLFERDNARAVRDGVRLVGGGYSPVELLARVAAYDARHAEYGSTHALAVSADCARFLERYPGERALYAIAPAIDMCSEANVRLPERPAPEPLPGGSARALREAVEAEDAARAEGLLRGAFAEGVPLAEIDTWMFGALSDHFLSFGHPLIYFVKAQELIERLGPGGEELARELYPALLYGTVLGTREDTLPYMAGYAERFGAIEAELPAVHARMDPERPLDLEALASVLLDGDRAQAFDALWDALRSGVAAPRVARGLVVAAARRLQRFDPAIDADPEVAENWLWATHRFTFASAVRNAVERWDAPDALRFLFQALAFVHSGHRMDLAPEARAVVAPEGPRATEPAEVLEAIAARDAGRAMAGTLAILEDGTRASELRHALEDLTLRDPLVRPIAVAHAIKTLVAAFEELEALGDDPARADPVLGAVRFLASPFQERRLHQTVGTSIRWVAQGVLPRKLTQ